MSVTPHRKYLLKLESSSNDPFESLPFQDTEKVVTVSLRDEKGNLVTGHDEVWFNIGMKYADDDATIMNDVVDVMNPEGMCVGPSGRSPVIRVRFLQCTGPQEVVLFLKPEIRTPSNISFPSYSISKPMRVVLYRTIITNESEIPTLWYNRYNRYNWEGGMKNQIRIKVRIVNSKGQPVTGQAVKLQCRLFYDNGEEVEDQTVLVIQASETRNCFTNPDTGEATINCRIHALTSKHRNHRFQVKVFPVSSDSSQGHNMSFFGAIITPGIDVRTNVGPAIRLNRARRNDSNVLVSPPLIGKKRRADPEVPSTSLCVSAANTIRTTELEQFMVVSRVERLWQQLISSCLSTAHSMMQTVNQMLTSASGHGLYVRPYVVVKEDEEDEDDGKQDFDEEGILNFDLILTERSSGSSSSSSRVSPTTIPSNSEGRDIASDDERLRIIGSNNNANRRPGMIPTNSLTSDSSHSWSSSCHTVSPTTIPFNSEGRDMGRSDDAEIDCGTFDED